MKTAWLISVGTELTLGQTVDTNAAWLAQRLAAFGLRAPRHVTVPDEVDAIRDVLLEAAAAADVILVTGGLGPTEDDLTRHALAAAAGVGLELHQPSVEQIRARFAARGREMPRTNTIQAMIPQGGQAIPNARGTAPGLRLTLGGVPCFVMPGVPAEMREMFDADIAPVLAAAADGAVLASRCVHTFGLGESMIGERIKDLMVRGRNPEVGTTADLGVVGVRINVRAASRAEADAQLEATEAELRRRLGVVVFGHDADTLPSVVGGLLTAAGATVATAESCTGGMIGAMLTDVPGSSAYYRGGAVTYANDAKIELLGVPQGDLEAHGAVSEPVARAMAAGAARILRADYAVGITGIAGPTGGTPDKPVGLVYIGIHTPAGTRVHERRLGYDSARPVIRMWAARTALNLLRLALLEANTAPPLREGA